jgi:hypothetical protein
MPIFQRLVNCDELFNQLTEPPIIINDLSNVSEEDRDNIESIISTRYSSDMISLLPSCRCGETKGEFSINVICEKCGTSVKSNVESSIEPQVWLRKPTGVNLLMSPIIWTMLKKRFTKSGYNVIQWLCDTTYHTQVKVPPIITKLNTLGLVRGYNNFVDNFDMYMDILFNVNEFKVKKNEVDFLRELITKERHKIFTNYLPLPNKSLLIVEKTKLGIYVDPIIVEAQDAIQMLVSIDRDFHSQNARTKENRTVKALSKLAEFYENYYKTKLTPKSALFRKHVFGSRTVFSARAVITSITDPHRYNDLYVPWGVGVAAFHPHLLNKLRKTGYDLNSALGILDGHVERYHPLIDKFLKELIDETPEKRVIAILQRNQHM